MTTHPPVPVLVAYADDELAAAEALDVRRHVASCATCDAVVSDHRRVAAWVARDTLAPSGATPSDGWSQIATRIRATRKRAMLMRVGLSAAAAVFVLYLAATGSAFRASRASDADTRVADHSSVAGAGSDLELAVAAGRSRLDSATNVAIGSTLSLFDSAIRETESALAVDPDNHFLFNYLTELRRKRVEALRNVVNIIRGHA